MVVEGLGTASRQLVGGLTFELTWRQRRDAKPAPQIMHTCTVARALWHAVGSQVERGVRPHRADLLREP